MTKIYLAPDADKRTTKIRVLNDDFRRTINGGHVYLTRGVLAHAHVFVDNALQCVRAFTDFNDNNDPHGEHDFGAFDLDGVRLFWKIDYHAPDLMHGSEDPSNAKKTRRVLTVLLAEEY